MKTFDELLNTAIVDATLREEVKARIHVAIIAAVYAGGTDALGVGFIDEFGADSYQHRTEYLDYAANYDKDLYDSVELYNTIAEHVDNTYAHLEPQPKIVRCQYNCINCINHPSILESEFPDVWKMLNGRMPCDNCKAGDLYTLFVK